MAFPASPANGQIYKEYTYNSTTGSWKKTQAIYDSGSNANGSWVKYSDGTMICRSSQTTAGAIGGSQYNNQFEFPAQFLQSPTVAVTHSPIGNTVMPIFTGGYAASATHWTAYFKVTVTQDISHHCIAIGKWR